MRCKVLVVYLRLGGVGRKNHDHVRPLGGLVYGEDLKAGGLSFLDGAAAGGQANPYVDARVLQVERRGHDPVNRSR